MGAIAGGWMRTLCVSLAGLGLACGGSGETTPSPTPTAGDPGAFVEPPEIEADDAGVVELHLKPAEVVIAGQRYCLRTYNGVVPGPTIRVPAGQDRRIRVNLHNDFTTPDWREVSGMEGLAAPGCHDFNLTNLHFHGGHVQPNYATADEADPCIGDGCAPGDRYYGDNVLIDVHQSTSAQYRWDIDEDGIHHEGTNWYHPHIHGSTAIQVVNGVAGALIVEGPLDAEPEVAATQERVLVINEIPYTHETTTPLADGETCTEANLSLNNFLAVTEGMPMLINGRVRPRLQTPPGQVERWRMIYAGTPDEMALKLHPGADRNCAEYDESERFELVQHARDGITLPHYYRNDAVWMSPGYRVDAFVQMPSTEQTLCLVGRRTHDLAGSVVAIIDVTSEAGTATSTTVPDEATVTSHAPPVSWTGKVDGETTEVSCESVEKVHQRVGLLMPPFTPMAGEQQSDGGTCEPPLNPHAYDPDAEVCECPEPNINCRNFDARRSWGYRSDRVAVVGTSEKWEIVAFDGHPFHIHINPFVVCPNNSNKEPNFAHWRDTFWVQVEDGPREILTEFRAFTGRFAEHCHKLNHEDEGMMELVELCAEDDLECQCQGTDDEGQCISQAGCRDDDLQCQFAALATAAYPLPPAPSPALCGP